MSLDAAAPRRPDFAFPETVSKDAAARLDKALKSGDDVAAIRAALNLTLAQNAIDSDRMPESLARLDSIERLMTRPAPRAVVSLIRAEIYAAYYGSMQWSIDSRPEPVAGTPIPDDYTEWSSGQFMARVAELLNAAMSNPDALYGTPLRDYDPILAVTSAEAPVTYTFYPSLLDFVGGTAIELLGDFRNPQATALTADYRATMLRLDANRPAPYMLLAISDITAGSPNLDSTFLRLVDLYKSHAESPYSGEALITLGALIDYNDISRASQLKGLVDSYIARFPNYVRINSLKNISARLVEPRASVSVPEIVTPGDRMRFSAEIYNLSELTVTLYRLPDNADIDRYDSYYNVPKSGIPATARRIASTTLRHAGTPPFRAEVADSFAIAEPGVYIAVTEAPGLRSVGNYPVTRATDLAVGALAFGGDMTAVVVSPLTGRPADGVSLFSLGDRNTQRKLGTTDADGFLALDSNGNSMNVYAVKGADRYAPARYLWRSRQTPDTLRSRYAQVYTDLALFHPGDTVQFAAVAYSLAGIDYRAESGRTLRATLRDANGQVVDTMKLVTDDFGRISGSFALPDDGRLNGYYSIYVADLNPGRGSLNASTDFMVSDYKLPTFEVKVTDAATDTPVKGAVTLRGSAVTYSGMPVAGAEVTVKVNAEMMWRPWMPYRGDFEPLTLIGTTDVQGDFSVEIPASGLAKAPRSAWFRAQVTVASAAGESQAASIVFTLGPAVRIEAALASSYNVAEAVTLPVRVVNTAGEQQSGVRVDWALLHHDSTEGVAIASGNFMSDNPEVDWRAVEPGMYAVRFVIDGDTAVCRSVALYNPAIDRSPSAELIWIPATRVNAGADILLGTSRPAMWVLQTVYDRDRIISREWLELPAGLHRIAAPALPDGSDRLTVSFMAAGDYSSMEREVTVVPAVDPRGLKLHVEALRDRITPGSTERIRFSVVDAWGKPVRSAVMLDIYNKALDALTPGGWDFGLRSPSRMYYRIVSPGTGGDNSVYLSASLRMLKETVVSLPCFQLYGQTFAPQSFRTAGVANVRMQRVSSMSMKLTAAPMMKSADVVDEAMVESDEAVMEESADNATAAAGASELDGGNGAGEAATPEVAWRDAETPLALFRPMLVTAPDGSLEVAFTAPDANATWAFQALAFTEDMRNASIDASILSQKPVMVNPNAPRFLREGDHAVILTSVMNSTDSVIDLSAEIELFEPSTGVTVGKAGKHLSLGPRSTAIVPVEAEAKAGLTMLGLRARAYTDLYSDGEQLIIPILPASTPVVDSEPFYMGPDTHESEIVMPGAPDATDVVTTLEFCENPVWYVVTALPGLAVTDAVTATQAADALFSAAVADGLVKRYPAIADALSEWTSRGASSEALTSMLERNADLKTMLLSATPWVMDARSETERMQRLALLFDKERVRAAINGSVATLVKLEAASGGWKWIAQTDEPSEWVTYRVLSTLATLSDYGFVPGDERVAEMTRRAVGFIDAEAVKAAKRDPKAVMVAFTALRSCFPDIKASAQVEAIMGRATQSVIKEWKSYALAAKPEAAMMLWRRGSKAVAADILASMREFMVTTPDKGTYFPSLQNSAVGYLTYTADALRAFATVEPGCAEIDGLRHWLVVQKQATDWGRSAAATDVVAAILASSQSWLVPAGGAQVKADGKSLAVTATDRRLGYFRMPLDVNAGKAVTIDISKPGDTPAWGAVMRRAVQPLRSVEASGSADLSISKEIIADSLATGGKVTVRLTVKVGRNLNYVAITDARAACFEPVDQLPSMQWSEGVCFYIEPRDSQTDIFITTMPKGTYILTYDVYVNNAGSFASGIATASSQYAPEITARSAGTVVEVKP